MLRPSVFSQKNVSVPKIPPRRWTGSQAMAALDPNAGQAAMQSMVQGPSGVPSPAAESAVAANLIRTVPPTRVLVLLNMVSEAELTDPQEYEVRLRTKSADVPICIALPQHTCLHLCRFACCYWRRRLWEA